jgi:N-acetylglucosaminyl-diphospho-decaprenol L-rhamnosyltransferase
METSNLSKVNISVIIPNYRSEQYLKANVASLYSKTSLSNLSLEVIVVNNDEREKLEEIRLEFQEAIILNHGENVGFGAAINLGAKKAKGKYLFFLNPDCEIISSNIECVIREFEVNPEIGIIGSQLIGADGQTQEWSAGTEITIINIIKNNIGLPSGRKIWRNKKKVKADWVAGTAMFIKREFFDKISGFDENFFMYFEDVDLCRRARNYGRDVYYFPEFKVRHFGGGSYKSKKIQKENYYNSQEQFFKKHYGRAGYLIIKTLRTAINLAGF